MRLDSEKEKSGHNRGSLNRLTTHTLHCFEGTTLFDKLARCLCGVGCMPRKELYEAWEMAKRVRRRFRGGRVIDMACGHGLLAHAMLLLDSNSESAIAVDQNLSVCGQKCADEIQKTWPRLAGRIQMRETDFGNIDLHEGDLVVSAHACGGLTDRIIDLAVAKRCRLAVLPCCHSLRKQDTGGFDAWLDGSLAIDIQRVTMLRRAGYSVRMQRIPDEITPKNRLILAEPEA